MARRKKRLTVSHIETVGLVDKGDDPGAEIVFWKRQSEGAEMRRGRGALAELLRELWAKVDAYMLARQGRTGGAFRDVGVSRVLAENPELHAAIEAAATADAVHKARAVHPQVEKRAGVDRAVTDLSKALAPDDPRLGMQLCERHFPDLMKRWRGVTV